MIEMVRSTANRSIQISGVGRDIESNKDRIDELIQWINDLIELSDRNLDHTYYHLGECTHDFRIPLNNGSEDTHVVEEHD